MILTGLSFLGCSLELGLRLTKQIRRVMDPSLLKTSNYHEVKHWIEPGRVITFYQTKAHMLTHKIFLELINFGWGQYDFEEEAKLLDENKLRKRNK